MNFVDFIYLVDWCTEIRFIGIDYEVIRSVHLVNYINCGYDILDDFKDLLNYTVVHIIPTSTYKLDVILYDMGVCNGIKKI